eukprot:evm.model.scf_247.4 EVM.evm.TU.scf_247.4   scf_247:42761-56043(-)
MKPRQETCAALRRTVATVMLLHAIAVESIKFERLDDSSVSGFERTPSTWSKLYEEGVKNMTEMPVGFVEENLRGMPTRAYGWPGAIILDIDNDGDLDIFVPSGPGQQHSLFLNRLIEDGELSFSTSCRGGACAGRWGLGFANMDGNGVCAGDIDNDGDQDIVILNFGAPWQLLRNDGRQFTEITITQENVTSGAAPSSCTFGDVDGDGLVDLFITAVPDFPNLSKALTTSTSEFNKRSKLFMNKGPDADEHFADETETRGFGGIDPNITWSAAFVDFDFDGDVDLFLFDNGGLSSPELGERGFVHVWINDGKGQFEIVHPDQTNLNAGSNRGHAFGDFNCDGHLDFFSTRQGSFEGVIFDLLRAGVFGRPPLKGGVATVARNATALWFFGEGDGKFREVPAPEDPDGNILYLPMGWGIAGFDMENDGDQDLVFAGGAVSFPVQLGGAGAVLENVDCSGTFRRSEALPQGAYSSVMTSGLSSGDLNNDGFMDFVVVADTSVPENADGTSPLMSFSSFLNDTNVEELSKSPFFEDAKAYPTFYNLETVEVEWSGAVDAEGDPIPNGGGRVFIEVNDADSSNNWVKVKPRGSVGDLEDGRVNRDGTGAMLFFTPEGGNTVMVPHATGHIHGAHDKAHIFGLGEATEGQLTVLWPGNVYNTLKVVANEVVVLAEIPCDCRTAEEGDGDYETCLLTGVDNLKRRGVIDDVMRERMFDSMIEGCP